MIDISSRYKPEQNKNNVYLKPYAPLQVNLREQYQQKQRQLLRQDSQQHWITDKLRIKDIEGAQSDVYGNAKHIRGADYHLTTDDIDGAKPRSRARFLDKPSFSLETSDLDAKRGRFVSRRNCNPLNPIYVVP